MDRFVTREPRDFPVPPQMMYPANAARHSAPMMMDGAMYEVGYGVAVMDPTMNALRTMFRQNAPPQGYAMYGAPTQVAIERPMLRPAGAPQYSGYGYGEGGGYAESSYKQQGSFNPNAIARIAAPDMAQNSPYQNIVGSEYEQRELTAPERATPARAPGAFAATDIGNLGPKHEQRNTLVAAERVAPVKPRFAASATVTSGGPAAIKSRSAPVPTSGVVAVGGGGGGGGAGAGGSSATFKDETETKPRSRADKQQELYKQGVRVFAGPVEKIIKWHKLLQDTGVVCLYELVGKVVGVRSGAGCAKHLLVRDEGGPVLQLVYYEIDFLLPELELNTTVRVVGKMSGGAACRLQAYSVRRASGDDVAALPRRAAIAGHQLAKLQKEYSSG